MLRLLLAAILTAAFSFAYAGQKDDEASPQCMKKAEPYAREWNKKRQAALEEYVTKYDKWEAGNLLLKKGYKEAFDRFAGFRKNLRGADPEWMAAVRDYRDGKIRYGDVKSRLLPLVRSSLAPNESPDEGEDRRSCRRWQGLDPKDAAFPNKASGEADAFGWGLTADAKKHDVLPMVSCYFQGPCDMALLRSGGKMDQEPIFDISKAKQIMHATRRSSIIIRPNFTEKTENYIQVCIEFNLLDILDATKDQKPTIPEIAPTSPYARAPEPFQFKPELSEYASNAIRTKEGDSDCAAKIKKRYEEQEKQAAVIEPIDVKGVSGAEGQGTVSTTDTKAPARD